MSGPTRDAQLPPGEISGGSVMDIRPTTGVQDYLLVIKQYFFLAIMAAVLALFMGIRGIKRSYLQRTPLQVIGNLLWSSGFSMALVIGSVSLLNWLYPDVSAQAEVGVAIFIGLFGLKAIDLYCRWKFGLKIIDPTDQDTSPQDKA